MRSTALAEDSRGRVPFALIGVLLLVSSLTLAPTLQSDPAPETAAVEQALTGVTAASHTAIRDGVARASDRAGAEPVITPANTSVGRALNESQPFRDALRLRIYRQVRSRLGRVSAQSGDVTATASLPSIESLGGYTEAIDRVRIQRAGANDTALRATIENVTLTVTRTDQVVTYRMITPTVVVPTPVLYSHNLTDTYERRLNAGLDRPGLSQRLTARLYPIAWARGYAQYGGAAIENVVSNRHVSLATNGAALGVQRSVFGRSDPEGRQALTEATAVVGIKDIIRGSNDTTLASEVLSHADYRPPRQDIGTGGGDSDRPRPNESMRIGINETADTAFRTIAAPDRRNETLRSVYTADVQIRGERTTVSGGQPDRPDPPEGEWSFGTSRTTQSATVLRTVDARPTVPEGWHTLDRFGYLVNVTHRRVVTWYDGKQRTTTTATRTERVRVIGALVGSHSNGSVAPRHGIKTAHDPAGSPVGGPNLADIEPKAEAELLGARGYDDIAESIARGQFARGTATVTGGWPDKANSYIYRDLRTLRETVRNITVSVDRGKIGSFQVNPAKQLKSKLTDRRSSLVAVPNRYEHTLHRASVAARIAYLNEVERRLESRAKAHNQTESSTKGELQDKTGGSLATLRRGLTARETRIPRSRPAPTGPAGPVRLRVDTQPQYLTRTALNESAFPAVNGSETPLVTRNINVFTIPYGHAASSILDTVLGSTRRVRLGTAAATLSAANGTDIPLRHRYTLKRSIRRATRHVSSELGTEVHAHTPASSAEGTDIVNSGLATWNTTAARGLALSNGSATERIADIATERHQLSDVESDWLRLQLRHTTTKTLATKAAKPNAGPVNRTAAAVRTAARKEVQKAVGDHARKRVEDLTKRKLGTRALPAGLPLAPPLTPWYATTNIWWVTVKGEYARFAVVAHHGSPDTPGGATYVRENGTVSFDADGDGESEVVGYNKRVSFSAETGIVIVVPPRPRGVGDKDGISVETSAGWPDPG
jgi:hypothetical protein